jgi:hypothetical protein
MTKAERRKEQLQRHYESLKKLAELCGVENPDGKKLSTKLLSIERKAHQDATDWCNGVINQDSWNIKEQEYIKQVQALFNNNLEGLFINGDARGHALKIEDKYMRSQGNGKYEDIGLHTDWGHCGILAPEITGD